MIYIGTHSPFQLSKIIIFRKMSVYGKKLAIGIAGVMLSTMSISYLKEKVFSQKYSLEGSNESHFFVYPSLITWIGCLFCSIYGVFYARFIDETPNHITLPQRLRLGVLFTLNYLPSNYALLYISYPLLIIAKNTRYFFVVIIGVFFSRVQKSRELKLPKSKVFIALIISLGAGMFMFNDSRKSSIQNHFHPQKKWIGFALLLIAIIFDSLFSDSQAYCKAAFKPSQNQLFLAANIYGFALIFSFSVLNGEIGPSFLFISEHPDLLKDIMVIASLQVIAQISIYYVVSNFKQHILPLISTVRKLFTILLSIYIFQHKVTFYQWVAIVIIFIAMGYELYDEVISQEKNRMVRMVRRRRREILQQSRERKEGEDEEERVSEREEKNIQEMIEIKVEDQPRLMRGRSNWLMGRGDKGGVERGESNSKYGYGWRRMEVAENRQSSLTPQKTKIM